MFDAENLVNENSVNKGPGEHPCIDVYIVTSFWYLLLNVVHIERVLTWGTGGTAYTHYTTYKEHAALIAQ